MTEEERENAIQKLKEHSVYAHVYQLLSTAREEMRHYIDGHKDEIKSVNYTNNTIICLNGDIHFFMNESYYKWWYLGQTYILNGKWYRNGIEIQVKSIENTDQNDTKID